MNHCSLVGALCLFLARSSLEFWQTTKSTWLWSKVWISSEVKYIWKNAISRGWDISTLSWVQNNFFRSIDFPTMVNTKPWLLDKCTSFGVVFVATNENINQNGGLKFSNKINLIILSTLTMAYLVISEQVKILSCCGRVSSSYLSPKVREAKTFSEFWSWDLWTWPRKPCVKKINFSEWKAFADILTLTFW